MAQIAESAHLWRERREGFRKRKRVLNKTNNSVLKQRTLKFKLKALPSQSSLN